MLLFAAALVFSTFVFKISAAPLDAEESKRVAIYPNNVPIGWYAPMNKQDSQQKFEGRLKHFDRRVLAAVEEVVPEAQNYDTSVPEPYGWLGRVIGGTIGTVVGGVLGPLGGAVGGSLGGTLGDKVIKKSTSDTSTLKIFGSATELKLYDADAAKEELLSSPVIRADLFARPLEEDVPGSIATQIGGKQFGVVATLSDGRQFLAVKGNREGRGSGTVLILENHMTADWVKVASNKVVSSSLGDFVAAGGNGYDVSSDNGRHAAQRMMALA